VELLVASAIFFIFMVAVAVTYTRGHEIYRRGLTRIEVQQSARIGLDLMVREIRMAGHDPSLAIPLQTHASAMQAAEAAAVTFLGDVDGDAVTDRVTYRRVGKRIVRETSTWDGDEFPAPESGEIVTGVTALSFAYFADGNALAAPVSSDNLGNIGRIHIDLVTAFETVDARASFPLSMDVRPRNL
jgi:hypothetical protein